MPNIAANLADALKVARAYLVEGNTGRALDVLSRIIAELGGKDVDPYRHRRGKLSFDDDN